MESGRRGDGAIEITVSRNPADLGNINDVHDYIYKHVLGRIYIEDEDEVNMTDSEDEESLSNLAVNDLEEWCRVVREGLQAFAELKDVFPRLYDMEYSHTLLSVKKREQIIIFDFA